jgi:hypothetical protein
MKTLKNDFISVSFFEKREYQRPYIIVKDLTDKYNEPTMYTRKVRGINNCWNFIEDIFEDEELRQGIKFNDMYRILDGQFNLDAHTYCAID